MFMFAVTGAPTYYGFLACYMLGAFYLDILVRRQLSDRTTLQAAAATRDCFYVAALFLRWHTCLYSLCVVCFVESDMWKRLLTLAPLGSG